MLHSSASFKRGAVCLRGNEFWLVWHAPICLAIDANAREQNTRLDYVLRDGDIDGMELTPNRWVVRAKRNALIEPIDLMQVGALTVAGLAAITTQFRRAAEAMATEARYRGAQNERAVRL